MTDYSRNVFYLNNYYFVFKGMHLVKIKNIFLEFNMFYKYLIQKRETLIKEK